MNHLKMGLFHPLIKWIAANFCILVNQTISYEYSYQNNVDQLRPGNGHPDRIARSSDCPCSKWVQIEFLWVNYHEIRTKMYKGSNSRTLSCCTNITCEIDQRRQTTNKKEGKGPEQFHIRRFSRYQGTYTIERWLN